MWNCVVKAIFAVHIPKRDKSLEVEVGFPSSAMWRAQRIWINREGRQHNCSTSILLPISLALPSGDPGKKEKNCLVLSPSPNCPLPTLSYPPIPLANYLLLKLLWKETQNVFCFSAALESARKGTQRIECDMVLDSSFPDSSSWD